MRAAFRLLLLAIGAAAAALVPVYRRERREAIRRLRAGTKTLQTLSGPLEYALAGEGDPVVSLHGAGGGYEQGLFLGSLLDQAKYQIIAPSRPGHRGTPLATGETFEAQADAVALLLDSLGIERAVMLCISGGGLPALQFALRHPDRCRALILVSAHGPETLTFLPNRKILWAFEGMALADIALWPVSKLPARLLLQAEGSPVQRLDDRRTAMAQAFFAAMFPAADWADGTRNDITQLFGLEDAPAWPLEQISAPTLVLHGQRDFIVRHTSAQRHAERIPNATMVTYDDGTHMAALTHHADMSRTVTGFLERLPH